MLSSSSLTLAWVSGAPAGMSQLWAFTGTAQATAGRISAGLPHQAAHAVLLHSTRSTQVVLQLLVGQQRMQLRYCVTACRCVLQARRALQGPGGVPLLRGA
jgi:hypothetical protein